MLRVRTVLLTIISYDCLINEMWRSFPPMKM